MRDFKALFPGRGHSVSGDSAVILVPGGADRAHDRSESRSHVLPGWRNVGDSRAGHLGRSWRQPHPHIRSVGTGTTPTIAARVGGDLEVPLPRTFRSAPATAGLGRASWDGPVEAIGGRRSASWGNRQLHLCAPRGYRPLVRPTKAKPHSVIPQRQQRRSNPR